MNALEKRQKTAVITGSSSGIGFQTSVLLAKNGFSTYATVHNLDKSKAIIDLAYKHSLSLKVLQLDVTEDISVKDAFEKIIAEDGRIDVVINNAGYGIFGSIEDLSLNELKAQYETNVFGAFRVIQAALPFMRHQRSGTIVNISSPTGRIPFPFRGAYGSSKFALEGLTNTLRKEVMQFGINVILIEPTATRTNFGGSLKIAENATNPSSPYSRATLDTANHFKQMLKEGINSKEVATVILEAVTSTNPKMKYNAGLGKYKQGSYIQLCRILAAYSRILLSRLR